MTSNQMMDYYIQPRHIYSHSMTCTHSILCRRPSSLVAFHIWYLPDHASIHEIWSLVIIIPVFPVYIRYLHPLWISLSIVYCMWWWPHMTLCISCLFMAIVLLCIQDCYMYLQSYAEIFVLYCWMVGSSTWFFITPLLGWTYNVFWPSYHPSNLTH